MRYIHSLIFHPNVSSRTVAYSLHKDLRLHPAQALTLRASPKIRGDSDLLIDYRHRSSFLILADIFEVNLFPLHQKHNINLVIVLCGRSLCSKRLRRRRSLALCPPPPLHPSSLQRSSNRVRSSSNHVRQYPRFHPFFSRM